MMFLFIVWIALFFSDQQSEDQIEWSEGELIVWDDFQGIPDSTITVGEAPVDAISYVSIKVELDRLDNYVIYSVFDKHRSWVLKKSDKILAHERLHFDITEIYSSGLAP